MNKPLLTPEKFQELIDSCKIDDIVEISIRKPIHPVNMENAYALNGVVMCRCKECGPDYCADLKPEVFWYWDDPNIL